MLVNYTSENQLKCFGCGCQKLDSVRREKKRCRYEWKPGKLPLHFTRQEWSNLWPWFFRRLPVIATAQETGSHRLRILPALTDVGDRFQKDIPDIFSGTVEVDETYIGAQWNHKRHRAKAAGSKRGRGSSKSPVFGISGRGGKVWAQVVSDMSKQGRYYLRSPDG